MNSPYIFQVVAFLPTNACSYYWHYPQFTIMPRSTCLKETKLRHTYMNIFPAHKNTNERLLKVLYWWAGPWHLTTSRILRPSVLCLAYTCMSCKPFTCSWQWQVFKVQNLVSLTIPVWAYFMKPLWSVILEQWNCKLLLRAEPVRKFPTSIQNLFRVRKAMVSPFVCKITVWPKYFIELRLYEFKSIYICY
jgi:hypothetical protein